MMKRRDLIKLLEKVGYRLDRTGSHAIYEKPGSRPIQVPNHREIKEHLAMQILKDAGL
jgi:mRNA interferase HicA